MNRQNRDILKQLGAVYRGEPLSVGDTLSRQLAYRCRDRGLILRDFLGDWVTTLKGRIVYRLLYPWTRRGAA